MDFGNDQNNISAPTPKVTWSASFANKIYEKWPKTDGNPEEAVFLKHCSSVDMEDELLINMLDAYGIPAVKQYPENGSLGKVVIGMSGNGADIFVPISLLEDARALMEGTPDDEL
ncbi:MAG: hypothetical protein RR743_05855 [Oscillospiraceae bacterium]